MIRPTRQHVTLESVRDEAPEVKTFTFSTDYDFEPGQFVNIEFEDDTIGRRSFSIASGPGERLELTIKRVGRFTNAIFDAPIGTSFSIMGPLGLPYVRGPWNDAYVCIAGGTGIAPFRSMMHDPRISKMRPVLIVSNRTREDIIYREEMNDWDGTIIHTLTRDEQDGMRTGRIDASLIESIENISERKALICGPPGLVSTSITLLTEAGIPMDRIKSETWN